MKRAMKSEQSKEVPNVQIL